MLPIPTTLATATLLATFAKATAPVTFAPVRLDNPAPLAVMFVTLNVLVPVLKVKLALALNALLLLN